MVAAIVLVKEFPNATEASMDVFAEVVGEACDDVVLLPEEVPLVHGDSAALAGPVASFTSMVAPAGHHRSQCL